jgi:hypothetical protein
MLAFWPAVEALASALIETKRIEAIRSSRSSITAWNLVNYATWSDSQMAGNARHLMLLLPPRYATRCDRQMMGIAHHLMLLPLRCATWCGSQMSVIDRHLR